MAQGSVTPVESRTTGPQPEGAGCLGQVLLVSSHTTKLGREDPLLRVAESVHCVKDAAGAVNAVRTQQPQLVIVEEGSSPPAVVATVQAIRAVAPTVPVVVTAASRAVDWSVLYMRQGVRDYIEYPLVGESLEKLVAAASPAGRGLGDGRFFSPDCPAGVPIVGHSPALLATLKAIRKVAESNCNPVLILGENGTGKELAARAVHAIRRGPGGPFVPVNCSTFNSNLMESELFGHVKGSFTGAEREKTGLFETAGTGTILLDEISEMKEDLQARLLRVLQEKTFRKVGGTEDIRCKATIIAASNCDLLAATGRGRFRKDLYYRLAVVPITMPPLACEQRRDDIPLLAKYFIEVSDILSARAETVQLDDSALEKLTAHNWPGNVRELKNVIDRALILKEGDNVTGESIHLDVSPETAPDATPQADTAKPWSAQDFSLETAERVFIKRALTEANGQRTRAAALLGITRATLHAKLKRYDISPPGPTTRTPRQRSRAPDEIPQDQPA